MKFRSPTRSLPIGAEVQPGGGVHFRVWAPSSTSASVEVYGGPGGEARVVSLGAERNGYFSGYVAEAAAGSRYRYRVDRGTYPDPASRFQPEGPHGPSEVVDPAPFRWTDGDWKGRAAEERVVYEMHLGTFSPEGTWRSAMEQLPELARLGITVVEVMPIAEFPGRFGWGYDGVDLFAPCRLYGTPDDARAFVDRAHSLGVMVILDVVYNHLGPEGNFLRPFADDYFSTRHFCEWGEAMNFDGPNSAAVREFFVSNARYWITEYHLDGLRLDATQQMFDFSPTHVVTEIVRAAREAAPDRTLFIVAENEPQDPRVLNRPEQGGFGLDAAWNDDFHHSAWVAASGRVDGYHSDYRGTAQELLSAIKHGFLYQGQWYQWQRRRRGGPNLGRQWSAFVIFLENHDQVANSLRGARLHQTAHPGDWRALTALLLLSPCTPMLFQGQEFAASSPFLYFADQPAELAGLVRKGRESFLSQFRTIACRECTDHLARPGNEETHARCRLDLAERKTHRAAYRLHEDLLRLRRTVGTLTRPTDLDGAVLREDVLVLRYFDQAGRDLLLLVNLGQDLFHHPAPEPLLAPIAGSGWRVLWSSEAPEYEGCGTPPLETQSGWVVPAHAAVLLEPHEHADVARFKLAEKD